jgi:hypothetical protein
MVSFGDSSPNMIYLPSRDDVLRHGLVLALAALQRLSDWLLASQAEVCDAQLATFADQEVARFEVAVNYAVVVQMFQAAQQLVREVLEVVI